MAKKIANASRKEKKGKKVDFVDYQMSMKGGGKIEGRLRKEGKGPKSFRYPFCTKGSEKGN